MIQYSITLAALQQLVDVHAPTWRERAIADTKVNVVATKLIKKNSTWSEIKAVYMRLQKNKCIYCERPLAGEVAGKVEQDVEHYRPKGRISAWPKAASGFTYAFPTGNPVNAGYYWLAYDLRNYAASCKPCNSTRKSDAFPITGARGTAAQAITALNAQEKPLLVFPFGAWGDDPAKIIRFEGIVALPVKTTGQLHQRAVVTIDFFGLNLREELWEDRFRTIRTVFDNVEIRETTANPARRAAAERTITDSISAAGPQVLIPSPPPALKRCAR